MIMKKLIKSICRFIGKIILFFDKILITPLMKLFMKITDFFKNNTKGLEKYLTSKKSLLVISLLIAFLAFYTLDKNSSIMMNNYAERIYGEQVNAIYNEEAYVIDGIPKTADVVLIGSKSNIFLAKQYPTKGISVDLRELSVGTHRVPLKYSQSFGFVDYKIDPSYVTVVIYNKISGKREVNYEVLHRESLDSKLDISDVTLSKTEVTVKGNEETLSKVGYVKALVDLNNLVNPKAGETTIKNCKLVAYDDNGNVVNVEIIPDVVEAKLNLVSSSRTVPIKVIPKDEGKLALGYAIASLTPSSNSIEIYGSEELINKVEYVPVYVDINGVSSNKSYTVNIDKPAGVRELSLKTITVNLTVTKESQKEVKDVRIIHQNLDPSLTVITTSEKDVKTTVIVKGSEAALKTLDESKVVATIDLADYTTTGEYEVDVKASGEDMKLTYEPKTTKVKVVIRKK
jgi:YbbR domain-containing protein